MLKIISSHLFAAVLIFGIIYYQTGANLLNYALMALVSLEMGFLAYHIRKSLFKGLAVVIWCCVYPQTLNALLGSAALSWDSAAMETREGVINLMLQLMLIVFILAAISLSTRLIMRNLKLSSSLRLPLLLIFTILASECVYLLQTTDLEWLDFFTSPLFFVNQMFASLTQLNLLFVLGMTVIQMLLVFLIVDD